MTNKSYKAAGVDTACAQTLVERIKPLAQATHNPQVLAGLGGFGALYELPSGYQQPVLVSGTDGVGTKILLAADWKRHASIGIDLVAMCVNDILTLGAKPLYFLDYYATGKLELSIAEPIIKGITDGCLQAQCALIGGETAEMPGCYPQGHGDLAGFAVGVVEKTRIIDGSAVCEGDQLVALASSGIHANGFSLIRRHLDEHNIDAQRTACGDESLADALMKPTRIYVRAVLSLLEHITPHAMVHITGGGFDENIPRILPDNVRAHLNLQATPTQPIYDWIAQHSGWSAPTLNSTFNRGIGFMLCLPKDQALTAVNHLNTHGEQAWICGEILKRSPKHHAVTYA